MIYCKEGVGLNTTSISVYQSLKNPSWQIDISFNNPSEEVTHVAFNVINLIFLFWKKILINHNPESNEDMQEESMPFGIILFFYKPLFGWKEYLYKCYYKYACKSKKEDCHTQFNGSRWALKHGSQFLRRGTLISSYKYCHKRKNEHEIINQKIYHWTKFELADTGNKDDGWQIYLTGACQLQ